MNSYGGRRVLIVGGFGYIGSHLAAALVGARADVTIVTPLRDRHRASAARVEAGGARVIEGDVRRLADMRAAASGQDVVFNVSGRSGALQSVHDPVGDLDVNCAGSLALLEAMRLDAPGAKLVFAGSRLVYGRSEEHTSNSSHLKLSRMPSSA